MANLKTWPILYLFLLVLSNDLMLINSATVVNGKQKTTTTKVPEQHEETETTDQKQTTKNDCATSKQMSAAEVDLKISSLEAMQKIEEGEDRANIPMDDEEPKDFCSEQNGGQNNSAELKPEARGGIFSMFTSNSEELNSLNPNPGLLPPVEDLANLNPLPGIMPNAFSKHPVQFPSCTRSK